MKKFVSMFVVLAMAFTMGPVVSTRAEDECVGDVCRLGPDAPNAMHSTNSTDWAWCKENPKDCLTYLGETALNKTKLFGGDVKDGVKWAYEKTLNGTKWVASEASDKWSNTVSPWLSEKADDVVQFEKQVGDFYNDDLNNQPKWTFWTLMASAGVGALTLSTWLLNLITCCCCGRCRFRMP